jgi:hypothetical protein
MGATNIFVDDAFDAMRLATDLRPSCWLLQHTS